MFVKKFSHIAPPVSIEELKTVQTDNGRFYLTPGKKNYPSVTTVCGYEKTKIFAAVASKESRRSHCGLRSVATLFTKRVRTI